MTVFLIILSIDLSGQVIISEDGSLPDQSAILEIKSTSKGLLLPRLTTEEMREIWKPKAGLVVFNQDSLDFFGFNGNVWIAFWDKSDSIERMCPDSILYSGEWYTLIQIGSQCWMAENLNVGTQIPGITYMSDNGIIEKHCYNDIADSCEVYGGLYQWNETMAYVYSQGTQGICPAGWHVPTVADWNLLADNLGGPSVAGGHLKAAGTRYWKSPNTGADNSSGFSAYGGGTYRPGGYDYYSLVNFCADLPELSPEIVISVASLLRSILQVFLAEPSSGHR